MVAETTETPASSNIASYSYDPDVENLVILFRDARQYTYFNVPAAIYRAMQAAPSAGSFFWRHIRGRYSYEQS